MSAAKPSASTFAALTDKELEILRLLAVGHTIKSIAAQLDRSEASINERLRDARRKTCTGSSRELARLLADQKNWDRNFGLSAPGTPANKAVQPPDAGRTRSKGTLMLIAALPLAALALALAMPRAEHGTGSAQAAHAAAPGPSPLAGAWSLDVDRIPGADRPRRVTIDFRAAPDRRWAIHVEIVGPDGSSQYADSDAATDGVAVPISGNMAFIDTVALRQPGPNTLVMTLGKNGAPVSTRVYTVAKDRKSMTETIVWAGKDIPRLETTYFSRIG